MFKIVTVLSLLVASSLAGVVPRWEGRIVGGQEAFEGQFPYIVSIRTIWNDHFCGGTIVSNRFIVTAAHCFDDGLGALPEYTKIVVGAHHISDDGTEVPLDRIITHPDFNTKGENEFDIAVLRTARSIPDYARRQISLVSRAAIAGESVTVSGWGHIWAMPGEPIEDPEFLQFLQKTVISHEDCEERFGRPMPKSSLCTTSPVGQGSCMGDSGGPLVNAANELAGVVSWGIPCAQGFPDVYGDVNELRAWVNQKMAQNAP